MNSGFTGSRSIVGLWVLVIAVITIIFTVIDEAKSCHRKVEYVTYYKKHPTKGHGGWGWTGNGGGGGHGHGGGYQKGYGHEIGGGYGKGHGHEKGYGGGHGKGHGGGHGGGGYEKGHGHEMGYGGGHGGYGKGHEGEHYESTPQHLKYRHSSYEIATYEDKDGYGHSGNHNGRRGHNIAHQNQKEYGRTGPYPNTEYSNLAITAIDPSGHSDFGVASAVPDLAYKANLIRHSKPNQNKRENIAEYSYTNPILEDTPSLSTSDSLSASLPPTNLEADLSTGNFDLNLEFNGDLPGPFRRSGTIDRSSNLSNGRKRKKISSTFKASQDQFKSLTSSSGDILKT